MLNVNVHILSTSIFIVSEFYFEEINVNIQKMFITVLFMVTENFKQPTCSSTRKGYIIMIIDRMEYYLII